MLDSITSCCPFPRHRRKESSAIQHPEKEPRMTGNVPRPDAPEALTSQRSKNGLPMESSAPQPRTSVCDEGGPSTGTRVLSVDAAQCNEAEEHFKNICGKSLKSTADWTMESLRDRIQKADKDVQYEDHNIRQEPREKAKSFALGALDFLGKATRLVSGFTDTLPIPSAASSMDMEAAWESMSSPLAQLDTYSTIQGPVNKGLLRQLEIVVICFVKLCAHLVRYQEASKSARAAENIQALYSRGATQFDNELTNFNRALQQLHNVEATSTFHTVKGTEQTVKGTQKEVKSLTSRQERVDQLQKIVSQFNLTDKPDFDARLTKHCIDVSSDCINGTGAWIWEHSGYKSWTGTRDQDVSQLLVLSGPKSSGKTTVSAVIANELDKRDRLRYVAHHSFPNPEKKRGVNNPFYAALKQMAFQFARADLSVRNILSANIGEISQGLKGTDNGLLATWDKLRIGAPESKSKYYLIFDGIENLPEPALTTLCYFVNHVTAQGRAQDQPHDQSPYQPKRRVGVLLTVSSKFFDNVMSRLGTPKPPFIDVMKHNENDLKKFAIDELKRSIRDPLLGQRQADIRDRIWVALSKKVNGQYELLELGLTKVVQLITSQRPTLSQLDALLEDPTKVQEADMQAIERLLTDNQSLQLNQLLDWIMASKGVAGNLSLDQLDSALSLKVPKADASITSLKHEIESSYSAILQIEDDDVFLQNGVMEVLSKRSKDREERRRAAKPTISMDITIKNANQEQCATFFWDLAYAAVKEKQAFLLDHSFQAYKHTITKDRYDATLSVVLQAFEYLRGKSSDETDDIGGHIVSWLPSYLGQLKELQGKHKKYFTEKEESEIAKGLHDLFESDATVKRHYKAFEKSHWWASEIRTFHAWLKDERVMRSEEKWATSMQIQKPVQGFLKAIVKTIIESFLRAREWNVANAYYWVARFMMIDENVEASDEASDNIGISDSRDSRADDFDEHCDSSDGNTTEDNQGDNFDRSSDCSDTMSLQPDHREGVSSWCQEKLGLKEEQLDYLWFERLADASQEVGTDLEQTEGLYRKALEKSGVSWRCHRSLAIVHYESNRIPEAVSRLQGIFKDLNTQGGPDPISNVELADLHLLLGQYAYESEDICLALEHYLNACEMGSEDQRASGNLGRLKATLSSTDNAAGAKELLQGIINAPDGQGQRHMASLFETVADAPNHDDLILNMLFAASDREDGSLLESLRQAMETLTTPAESTGSREHEKAAWAEALDDEARGILLYYRGLAERRYDHVKTIEQATKAASKLWEQSEAALRDKDSTKASNARYYAVSALANLSFEASMKTKPTKPLKEDMDRLKNLSELSIRGNDSKAFLSILYAHCQMEDEARNLQRNTVAHALRLLSDDWEYNDRLGYVMLQSSLGCAQPKELSNVAMAISLVGQPDLVKEALSLALIDVRKEFSDQSMLDETERLIDNIKREVWTRWPSPENQKGRLDETKVYFETLAERDAAQMEMLGPAIRIIKDHLERMKSEEFPAPLYWCDGRTRLGKKCRKTDSAVERFYYCLYCDSRNFCQDCVDRLLDERCKDIPVCSSNHKWLLMEPQGHDMYVGPKADRVRKATVRPSADDERVMVVCFEDGDDGITVKSWKEQIATDWGIHEE